MDPKTVASFRHEYGSGTSSGTAPPSPPDTRGVDYAAYCEGVAAQLAGNPAIPTASTTTHRRVLAHALGRHDSAHHADILTLAKLAEVLDNMLAPPAAPSAT